MLGGLLGGSGINLADNQSSSYQSGGSRLCNSFVTAFCVAPLVIFVSVLVLGWNEQHSVCQQKVIYEGKEKAVQVLDCDNVYAGSGGLVMMNCDIQKPHEPLHGGGAFAMFSHVGTGLRTKAEMLQCVQEEHKETHKDAAGGGKTTVTTYTYSTKWVDHPVDSGNFAKPDSSSFRNNCGTGNPRWPADVPQTGEQYVKRIHVGAFTTTLVRDVPLNTPVSDWGAPDGWTRTGEGSFESSRWKQTNSEIGMVRVSFMSNDWDRPQATLLGQNNAGSIQEWIGSSSWLCSGFSLETLRMGYLSRQTLFDELAQEETMRTWIFRLGGFVALWIAFSCCLAPLGIAADCIPCIGGCLSEAVEGAACCFACMPASTLCILVCGICWLVMRPVFGVFMVLLAGGLGFLMFFAVTQAQRSRKSSSYAKMEEPPAGLPMMSAPVQAQPLEPAGRQMQVAVPAGCGPGSMVQVQTPDGTMRQVVVPAGVSAGSVFTMQY